MPTAKKKKILKKNKISKKRLVTKKIRRKNPKFIRNDMVALNREGGSVGLRRKEKDKRREEFIEKWLNCNKDKENQQ